MMQEIQNQPIHPSGTKLPKWLLWLFISALITLVLILVGGKFGILGLVFLLPLTWNKRKSNE
ncbi:MAG: hypothetical protein N2450_05485 [bacterium]|nr:hypothetical protein [bacterium]